MPLPNFTSQDATTYKTAIDTTAADHESRIGTAEGDITNLQSGKLDASRFPNVNADVPTSDEELSGLNGLTASRAVVTDATGIVSVSPTTLLQISYLSSVTSNVQTQLNGKAPEFSGALIYLTSDQSISNATFQSLTFHAESYDSNNFFSGASPTRLTVPSGATKIRLNGEVGFQTNASGDRVVSVRKNGSTANYPGHPGLSWASSNIPDYKRQFSSGPLAVSGGDYFELWLYQSSGVALNARSDTCWFSIEVLG